MFGRAVVARLGALAFLLLPLLGGAPGCDDWNPCPPMQKLQRGRSIRGQVAWCKTEDGTQARWIEFHKGTERPIKTCDYLGGKAEGEFRSYHANGALWVQGQYREGLKQGRWELWNEAGLNKANATYRDGSLIAGVPVGGSARCEDEKP